VAGDEKGIQKCRILRDFNIILFNKYDFCFVRHTSHGFFKMSENA